ncbi:hypothetical protein CYMTET_25901, partial [Cymbomonas tetramitiformis]
GSPMAAPGVTMSGAGHTMSGAESHTESHDGGAGGAVAAPGSRDEGAGSHDGAPGSHTRSGAGVTMSGAGSHDGGARVTRWRAGVTDEASRGVELFRYADADLREQALQGLPIPMQITRAQAILKPAHFLMHNVQGFRDFRRQLDAGLACWRAMPGEQHPEDGLPLQALILKALEEISYDRVTMHAPPRSGPSLKWSPTATARLLVVRNGVLEGRNKQPLDVVVGEDLSK